MNRICKRVFSQSTRLSLTQWLAKAVKFLSVSACLGASALSIAQVHKCSLPSGKIEYQSAPCAQGGQILPIKVDKIESDPALARFSELAAAGRVAIGMPKALVLRAWGSPSKINRTITASSQSEQWVYERDSVGSSQYLYLENGVLRSMQSP